MLDCDLAQTARKICIFGDIGTLAGGARQLDMIFNVADCFHWQLTAD